MTFPHGCTQVSSVTPHGTHNGRFGPIWAVFRSEIDFSDPGRSSRCGAWRRRLTKSHIIHMIFQSIRAAAHTDHTRPPAGPNTAKHSLGPETRRRPCARPRMSRSRPPAPFTPYHCARKSSAGGRSRGALSHSKPVHLRPPYMSTYVHIRPPAPHAHTCSPLSHVDTTMKHDPCTRNSISKRHRMWRGLHALPLICLHMHVCRCIFTTRVYVGYASAAAVGIRLLHLSLSSLQ